MRGYKGFDKNMKCRGFQFVEGETYEEENAELCKSGFHACENPLDCLDYYRPGDGSVYHVVELEEVSEERGDDSKRVGKRIKIGAALDVNGICKAHFDYVKANCKESSSSVAGDNQSVSTGYRGSVAAGDHGAAYVGDRASAAAGLRGSAHAGEYGSAAAGYHGAAVAGCHGASVVGTCGVAAAYAYGVAAAGFRGSASAGYGGVAATKEYGAASAGMFGVAAAGFRGSAAAGEHGIACAQSGKVKGDINAVICASETFGDETVSAACAIVDGKTIKADTWYKCVGGKLVEVEDEG